MFIGREKELALLQQDYIGKAAMVYGKKLIYCRSIVLEKTCNMVAILFHGTCFITW